MKFQIFFLIFLYVDNTNSKFMPNLQMRNMLDLVCLQIAKSMHHLIIFKFMELVPEENLILRLFAPDETIAKFDQLTTNAMVLLIFLLTWPQPSSNFP